jgi:hypothetical protein
VYNLTISTQGKVLRSSGPFSARQTLRDWFDGEATGYDVTCQDEGGGAVTKAQLRDVVRLA